MSNDKMREAKDADFKLWLPKQNGNVGQESYEPWSDGYSAGYQAAQSHQSAELQVLQKEMEEQCRIIGAGGERELKLQAELQNASARVEELVEAVKKVLHHYMFVIASPGAGKFVRDDFIALSKALANLDQKKEI